MPHQWKGPVTQSEGERWIRIEWGLRDRAEHRGDKKKRSVLGRTDRKPASIRASPAPEEPEVLGFLSTCCWQLCEAWQNSGSRRKSQPAGMQLVCSTGLHQAYTAGRLSSGSSAQRVPPVWRNTPRQGVTSLCKALYHLCQCRCVSAGCLGHSAGCRRCWFCSSGCWEGCGQDYLCSHEVWMTARLRRWWEAGNRDQGPAQWVEEPGRIRGAWSSEPAAWEGWEAGTRG